ncbi:MAG: Flavodoxin domain protein [Candidatus Methanofastidiosum methylothiophilum]|uniref:Flavodoxin domain protein n=1 Tax=Candidatus Methanofastidiosum methylothiophilum TaxID=1705564 RepID=A0A150J1F4_9EURY|nr:MAG: Flavodoxin domain protein [Candidatus Methanofastidiosum methylthiophilus]KYC48439.1 MAG: Flavodoxin domain protein [Candidatus Methanofastidiosum methylthiophilus]KYC51049.1 MAG: Flavodoxin domain protein [Candidatus Methanofastidiosum methylthiophilus]
MTNNLLVYDTKYGSTEIIARWISEEVGNIDVKKASEVTSIKDYSLIVIGSPDYDDKPLVSISEFMKKFNKELKEKKIAIFVVCNDLEEGEYKGKQIGGKFNLEILRRELPKENIILEDVLGGVFNPKILDENDQERIVSFFNEIGKPIKKEDLVFMPIMNKLDRAKCKEFINKLKAV